MTHRNVKIRPAMTAIAAVIALSSTAAFAQSVDTPAPIVESTPEPAPAAPDPLAPAPTVTDTTSTAEPVASETVTPPAATARRAATASRPAARARPTTTRRTSITRTVAAAPAIAATAAPVIAAPVEPVPALPELAPPVPIEPVVQPTPVAADSVMMDEALPIAGAAGLGLLALLGAGMAMRRRRRREEDALEAAKWQHIESAPEAVIEPASAPTPEPAPTFVRTPMPDPVPVAAVAAASTLPDGFDVSRFGPHVQAAYNGPTEDNPSASLKRRLTVGHFLDKQDAEAVTSAPATVPAAKPARAARAENDFMFRRAETKPGQRPVYQK